MLHNLSCLENIVGYKTPCETVTSKSGYYINDLHGITFRSMESVADEEYKNGKQFIIDLINQSKMMVIDEMEMHLRPFYNQATLLSSVTACDYADGYVAGYAGDAGIKITKQDGSRYTRMLITKITVCINSDANIALKINDGGVITTYAAVSVTAGVPKDILLDYGCNFDSATIYFDQTGLNVRNTSCLSGCGGCGTARLHNQTPELKITGIQGSTETTSFNGIIPTIGIECTQANLICDFSKYLGLPVLYKFGGLFYKEVSASKRWNKYTTYQKEDAEKKSLFYDNFDETELGLYQRQMRSIIKSIYPYLNSINDDCIVCNQNRYAYTTG